MISFVSFFLVQNQKEVLERTNKFKILKEVIDVARKEKYYGTLVMITGNQYEKLVELGYKGYHNQFGVVCKAKSMAEANRIASIPESKRTIRE